MRVQTLGKWVTIDHAEDLYDKAIVLSADTSFYKMFDYPFFRTGRTLAVTPSGITITEKLVVKIFGKTDVPGKLYECGNIFPGHFIN